MGAQSPYRLVVNRRKSPYFKLYVCFLFRDGFFDVGVCSAVGTIRITLPLFKKTYHTPKWCGLVHKGGHLRWLCEM